MKGMVHMIHKLKGNIGSVFVGKENVIDLLLVSLLADGHALLEDVVYGLVKRIGFRNLVKYFFRVLGRI